MGRIIVMNQVTLDGVMQGPGRPDEDTRDGFVHGGWAVPRSDETIVAKMGGRMGGDRAFLFGRRTYEDLLASWNAQGGSFKEALNNARKYVASSNPATRLDWPNSTLLRGDIPASVADLKEQSSDTNLVIMGSGVLIGSLMAADLIDEYLLMIHPLVLGTGRRLFPVGVKVSLRLTDSVTSSTGVLIASSSGRGAEGLTPMAGLVSSSPVVPRRALVSAFWTSSTRGCARPVRTAAATGDRGRRRPVRLSPGVTECATYSRHRCHGAWLIPDR